MVLRVLLLLSYFLLVFLQWTEPPYVLLILLWGFRLNYIGSFYIKILQIVAFHVLKKLDLLQNKLKLPK